MQDPGSEGGPCRPVAQSRTAAHPARASRAEMPLRPHCVHSGKVGCASTPRAITQHHAPHSSGSSLSTLTFPAPAHPAREGRQFSPRGFHTLQWKFWESGERPEAKRKSSRRVRRAQAQGGCWGTGRGRLPGAATLGFIPSQEAPLGKLRAANFLPEVCSFPP